ncbi:MAG: hypothetical protein RIC51_04065, partial [Erythrobacter sp.]
GNGARARTPWHVWVVGVIGLLWNGGGGAANYLEVKQASPEFFAQQAEMLGTTPEVVSDYFANYPLWADIAYGFGVWGAVAGSVLLLLRSRFAGLAFALSAIGFVFGVVYQLVAPLEGLSAGVFFWGFNAVIFSTIIGQWLYARWMAKAGVLT